MSKEEIYAKYLDLMLEDKLILANAILYDLDVGDYSAQCEGREDDWKESFIAITTHLEREIGKRLSTDATVELERRARIIKESH